MKGGFLLEEAKPYATTQPPHPVVLSGCQALFGEAARLNADPVVGFHVKSYSNVSLVGCQTGDYERTRPNTGFHIETSERISITSPAVARAWNHGIRVTGSTQVAISDAMIQSIGVTPRRPAVPSPASSSTPRPSTSPFRAARSRARPATA